VFGVGGRHPPGPEKARAAGNEDFFHGMGLRYSTALNYNCIYIFCILGVN